MKKVLKGLGIFGTVILTVVLSIVVFLYVVILNVKFVVSEKGMANTLKNIDVVETLKTVEDGTVWEDFKGLGENLNLSEEQFEQILSSDKVKEEVGIYISEVLGSITSDKEALLTKERMENFLNIAVDEYNKISNTKISETERQEIVNSFDEEMIDNMNEEIGSINLQETVAPEYIEYINLADKILFGNYASFILLAIIIIIGLIALFRFSYYKWMPYVQTSTIIVGSLMLIIGAVLFVIPLQDMEIILPLKNVLITNVFITSGVLFVISIVLFICNKCLKKLIVNKKEKTIEENMI